MTWRKRLFDLFFASLLVIILGPVLIWLVIYLLSYIIGSFTDVPVDPTPILATPIFQNGRRLLRINAGAA